MIYFITQRDPFFVDSFFNTFDEFGIQYTVINLPNFNKGFIWAVARTFKLYGVIGFLHLLYIRIFKLKKSIKFNNMTKQLNFKSIDETKNILTNLKEKDILISLSAPCEIPIEWLGRVRAKVNIHCGKLPKYAGMMPIFWQIYDGNSEIFITVHDLAKGIDTGKIFMEKKTQLNNSLFETSRLAKKESAFLLKEFLQNVESFIKEAKKDNSTNSDKSYRKFPTKREIKDFKKIYPLI
jgi:methionyl-tRNA formyltransferase